MPLGWPAEPDDLFVDDDGQPVRLDKAFSWEYPLSVHGMMHNVITNAWRGDPYPIDTLMIFMANMAWNSSMNTGDVRKMLTDKDENGEYKIPFLVVCDAYQSEMVAFADLVLPDTTYLERHDVMSMLDRPISEFDGPVDSVRIPILPPKGECKPFQDVLIELGYRLQLPIFINEDGSRKYKDYPDFVVNFEAAPGIGLFICTSMIYASLKFLQEWYSPLTVINYILLGTASGFTLAALFSVIVEADVVGFYVLWAVILTIAAFITRVTTLLRNRHITPKSNLRTAIGMRHTIITQKAQGAMGGSFNTREFFHHKSLTQLEIIKNIFLLLVFPIPILLLLAVASGLAPLYLAIAAFVIQYLGLLAERWYFFTEGKHPQNLYYQSVA